MEGKTPKRTKRKRGNTMRIYHMIVGKASAERMGDMSTRKEYKSAQQGAAPAGYVCIGVCGYHEEKRRSAHGEEA